MKRTTLSLLALAAATPLLAQATIGLPGAAIGSNFVVALICGVIIAFAIQYLLTAISVAAGVSAIPNLKEKYAEAKAHDRELDARHGLTDDDDTSSVSANYEKTTPVGVKVSAGIGLWNLVTTSIALFTGAALAMKLVPEFAETPGTSVTLALTIWGTFFMLLFWLESRFASTLVGGLISTATSGLRSAAESVKQLVTPSPASQVESVADATIDKLEASFGGTFDTDRIVGAIQDFGKRVESAGQTVGEKVESASQNVADKVDDVPSYDQLVSDLRSIMNESSERGKNDSNPAKWTAIQSVIQSAIDSGESSGSEKGEAKSGQLKQLLSEFKAEYDRSGDAPSAGKAAVKRAASAKTDLSDEEIEAYVTKIEDALRTSSASDLGSGRLGEKLQSIVNGDGASVAKIAERLGSLDRDGIATLLADNTSLTKEKVDTYVDQALSAVTMVRERLSASSSSDASLLAQARDLTDADLSALAEKAKRAVADYLQTDDSASAKTAGSRVVDASRDNVVIVSEEDALAALKRDLVKAMNNPADTLSILRNRLDSFDAGTVLDLLPVNQSQLRSKRAELERTLNEAKAEVETRANHLQAKAQGALRQAERRAVIEAEHARKTAASAAWWLVLSIVVSGVASLGGALLS